MPAFFLPLVILLEFVGGLAILLGFLTRFTALFTAAFTILTAFLFHSNFAEGVNQLMFMKNLSIEGGFLELGLMGQGAYSLDRLLRKKRNRPRLFAKHTSGVMPRISPVCIGGDMGQLPARHLGSGLAQLGDGGR